MIIRFKNWERYNGRSDVVNCTWFRLSNSFLQDPKIYSLEIEEVYAMLYLLCEASKSSKKGEVYINHDHARNMARISNRNLDRTIEKLKELQLIETRALRGTFAAVALTDRQTDIQTDRQSESSVPENQAPSHLPQFETIKEIIKSRNISLKVQEAWASAYPDSNWICQEIKKAIAWEAANPQKKKRHFSRFMGNWLSSGWDKSRKFLPSNKPSPEPKPLKSEFEINPNAKELAAKYAVGPLKKIFNGEEIFPETKEGKK